MIKTIVSFARQSFFRTFAANFGNAGVLARH